MKKSTVIIGTDGFEYVFNGSRFVEKCLHKTCRDESAGVMRKEVCANCGKVLIYNPDTSKNTLGEYFDEPIDMY